MPDDDAPDNGPDHDFSGRLKKPTDKRSLKEIEDAARAATDRVAVNSGEQALAAFYLAFGGTPDGFFQRINRREQKRDEGQQHSGRSGR